MVLRVHKERLFSGALALRTASRTDCPCPTECAASGGRFLERIQPEHLSVYAVYGVMHPNGVATYTLKNVVLSDGRRVALTVSCADGRAYVLDSSSAWKLLQRGTPVRAAVVDAVAYRYRFDPVCHSDAALGRNGLDVDAVAAALLAVHIEMRDTMASCISAGPAAALINDLRTHHAHASDLAAPLALQ